MPFFGEKSPTFQDSDVKFNNSFQSEHVSNNSVQSGLAINEQNENEKNPKNVSNIHLFQNVSELSSFRHEHISGNSNSFSRNSNIKNTKSGPRFSETKVNSSFPKEFTQEQTKQEVCDLESISPITISNDNSKRFTLSTNFQTHIPNITEPVNMFSQDAFSRRVQSENLTRFIPYEQFPSDIPSNNRLLSLEQSNKYPNPHIQYETSNSSDNSFTQSRFSQQTTSSFSNDTISKNSLIKQHSHSTTYSTLNKIFTTEPPPSIPKKNQDSDGGDKPLKVQYQANYPSFPMTSQHVSQINPSTYRPNIIQHSNTISNLTRSSQLPPLFTEYPPLHSIPPPKPLSLNQIPSPRDLDLNAIPEPTLNLDTIRIPDHSISRG